MKIFFYSILLLFSVSYVSAQITITDLSDKKYQFNSDYPSEDLHFYLFGDGYHSFEHNPIHHFGDNVDSTVPASAANVVFYHTPPYTDDEPIDDLVLTISNGSSSSSNDSYNLDNKISLKRSWNFVNSEDNFVVLSFENRESDDPISGCIEFHYKAYDTHIAEVEVLDDYNNDWVQGGTIEPSEYTNNYTHKISWTYSDLAKDEQRFIYIPSTCFASSMSKVRHMAIMQVNECDSIAIDSKKDGSKPGETMSPHYTMQSKVAGNPHDPNCIIARPNCLTGGQDAIRYRVYFQNEGEDPSEDVILKYKIFDPFMNIQLIDASHNCFFQLSSSIPSNGSHDNFVITFPQIFLRGLREDHPFPKYEDTYGWVEFDVCYDYSLFHYNDHCADSTVDIIFTGQAPVKAVNSICKKSDCVNHNVFGLGPHSLEVFLPSCGLPINPFQYINLTEEAFGLNVIEEERIATFTELEIYPNPGSDFITVKSDFETIEYIYITNVQGKLVKTISKELINDRINVSDFTSGMYYISIVADGYKNTKPFIKL